MIVTRSLGGARLDRLRDVGFGAVHLDGRGLDAIGVKDEAAGTTHGRSGRICLRRRDAIAGSGLALDVHMDRNLAIGDTVDVEHDLAGRDTGDVGLARNVEHLGTDFKYRLSQRDAA